MLGKSYLYFMEKAALLGICMNLFVFNVYLGPDQRREAYDDERSDTTAGTAVLRLQTADGERRAAGYGALCFTASRSR